MLTTNGLNLKFYVQNDVFSYECLTKDCGLNLIHAHKTSSPERCDIDTSL